jgi:hypothetical protein
MDWIVVADTPSSLRAQAGEVLRLAAQARNAAVARELDRLAKNYLAAAQRIEEGRERVSSRVNDNSGETVASEPSPLDQSDPL